ncbi:MAG: type II toxin-antitoxin system RelE/ParE family toxin [Chitinophagaceae bacterium]|nr:type II toxin-antitoxin system RelE/ParE family toxin [Chitinophagaceae bacterium]
MVFNVLIRNSVWEDVVDAVDWYEEESPGLGERFFRGFEETKDRVLKNPFHYFFVTKEVRRCPFNKFPYSILYIAEPGTIVILAVIHRKRSNAFIRRKLRKKE